MKRKKIIAFLLLVMLICSAAGWAGVSDATSMMKDKAVAVGKNLGGIPVNLIGLVASVGWAVGEIVVFPFRWIAKPFRHKSPY